MNTRAKDSDITMKQHVASRGQRGASLVEVALLVALVAIVAIPATKLLGNRISAAFCSAQQLNYDPVTTNCVPLAEPING